MNQANFSYILFQNFVHESIWVEVAFFKPNGIRSIGSDHLILKKLSYGHLSHPFRFDENPASSHYYKSSKFHLCLKISKLNLNSKLY